MLADSLDHKTEPAVTAELAAGTAIAGMALVVDENQTGTVAGTAVAGTLAKQVGTAAAVYVRSGAAELVGTVRILVQLRIELAAASCHEVSVSLCHETSYAYWLDW